MRKAGKEEAEEAVAAFFVPAFLPSSFIRKDLTRITHRATLPAHNIS
jgi:hypothetical protein